MKMTESEVKYLAGLMDADGSLFFQFVPYRERFTVRLVLILQQSLSIDREGKFIKSLVEYGGSLQTVSLKEQNPNWADANRWVVREMNELNMLVPRLTKHMVIKAKHWDNLLGMYRNIHGKSVTEREMVALKEASRISRLNSGPLHEKKHPSWGWVAGYLDGDGCYYMRNRNKNGKKYIETLVRVVAENSDIQGLELLHKAFGGILRKNDYENTFFWSRNLGPKDYSFAVDFLRKVHYHSQLKKHKIEQLLHYHSQRLSDRTSTEGAIV